MYLFCFRLQPNSACGLNEITYNNRKVLVRVVRFVFSPAHNTADFFIIIFQELPLKSPAFYRHRRQTKYVRIVFLYGSRVENSVRFFFLCKT